MVGVVRRVENRAASVVELDAPRRIAVLGAQRSEGREKLRVDRRVGAGLGAVGEVEEPV